MSNTFLNQLIERILSDKDVPLHDVAVILPNRRARRLLLQNLHQANGCKPMFAPQIFPMEEFVAWLSPFKEIDQVTQLLRLHELTREFSGERFTTHQLLTWGVAFLKDISDMDMQLQDVSACLREYAEAAKFEIPFGKGRSNFGCLPVRMHASMISRSRCVPTNLTSCPFSLAGNARADPIMPEPTIVMTAIDTPSVS